MKRERRRELQTNLLADWLAETAQQVRPYANTIVTVVLLAAVISVAWLWWTRHAASGSEQEWDAYHHALSQLRATGNPSALDELAERTAGSEVSPFAAVEAGDYYLEEGTSQIFHDKALANQNLQKALASYQRVLKESRISTLRERATFGLARTYESLSGTRRAENELQQAIDSYQAVVKEWPQGPYAEIAARRAEELQTPDIKRFYDKLAQYDTKAVTGPGPLPGPLTPGAVPPEPPQKPAVPKSGSGSPPRVPAKQK
jgi:predicted negative regulator of RcsB-dependent stress response